jgi:hypothetical protein
MHGCVLLTSFFSFYRLCVNSKIWAVFSHAFLDRWLEETNNFALRVGEMTMTLDDITCLLHLTFQGRLMDHTTLTKVNSVNMIGFVLRMLHSTGHPAAWLPLLERLSIQWIGRTLRWIIGFDTIVGSQGGSRRIIHIVLRTTIQVSHEHHTFTQNHNKTLGLWAFSFIKCSISTF